MGSSKPPGPRPPADKAPCHTQAGMHVPVCWPAATVTAHWQLPFRKILQGAYYPKLRRPSLAGPLRLSLAVPRAHCHWQPECKVH